MSSRSAWWVTTGHYLHQIRPRLLNALKRAGDSLPRTLLISAVVRNIVIPLLRGTGIQPLVVRSGDLRAHLLQQLVNLGTQIRAVSGDLFAQVRRGNLLGHLVGCPVVILRDLPVALLVFDDVLCCA